MNLFGTTHIIGFYVILTVLAFTVVASCEWEGSAARRRQGMLVPIILFFAVIPTDY